MQAFTPRLCFLSVAASLALALSARAQATPPPAASSSSLPASGSSLPAAAALSPDALADFTWFSTLGYPDVKGLPFGRYASGRSSTNGAPLVTNYQEIFLLPSNALTLSLDETTPGPFEPLSLKDFAHQTVANLTLFLDDHHSLSPTPRTEIFILAWACWRNGLNAEAQLLYQVAQTLPASSYQPPYPSAIRATLENDLSWKEVYQALENFRDPSLTRPQLLAGLQAVMQKYPHNPANDFLRQDAATLEEMITEDAAHPAISDADLAKLPADDRIRELIFRLRDQQASEDSYSVLQFGSLHAPRGEWPDFLSNHAGDPGSPAQQLVDLAPASIPQLIAALDNPSFTRVIGVDDVPSDPLDHIVMRVSDCAAIILEHLAGHPLGNGARSLSYARDGDPAAFRAAAQDWWTQYQQKGEKQLLIDSVASAGPDAAALQLLKQKYPDAVTDALIQGIGHAANQRIRIALISALAKSDDPRALAFLNQNTVNSDPSFSARAAAATGLLARGHPEVIPPMIQAWEIFVSTPSPQRGNRLTANPDATALINFLLDSNSSDALTALTRDLSLRSPQIRFAVLQALASNRVRAGAPRTLPAPTPTSPIIEAALVSELGDTTTARPTAVVRSPTNPSRTVRVTNQRFSDLAAYALNQRFPSRYPFDPAGSIDARNAQILAIQNTYNQAHPPTPAPSLPASNSTLTAPSTPVTTATVSPDALADFTWFSTLGFPDLKDKPFGHYQYGTSTTETSTNTFTLPVYSDAFLLSGHDGNATLLTLGLVEKTLPPSDPDELKTTGPFVPASLKDAAQLASADLRDYLIQWGRLSDRDNLVSPRTHGFVLAWACWRQGLNFEADQIYQSAEALSGNRMNPYPPDVRFTLEDDFGNLTFSRALAAFRHPGLTRPEFVARLQDLLQKYPHCGQASVAQYFVSSFQKTIAEDAAHPAVSPTGLAKLPLEQRIPELIFQLRNARGDGLPFEYGGGSFWGNPFTATSIGDFSTIKSPPSVADQLVAIGYPAVPALIAALDDTTCTRNSADHPAGINSFQHVGQLAAEILQSISGRGFYPGHGDVFDLLNTPVDTVPPEVRQAINAWWTVAQAKGEKATLSDGVLAGDDDSGSQAGILLAKFPGSSATVIQAFHQATNANVRDRLLGAFASSTDPAAIAFLQKELSDETSFSLRATAATSLLQLGHREAIPAVIAAWQASASTQPPTASSGGESNSPTGLLDFLTKCDSPAAIAALAQNLRQRPTSMRDEILTTVYWSSLGYDDNDGETWPVSPATHAAMEALFISELDDTTFDPDYRLLNRRDTEDPNRSRLCDDAAHSLSLMFPNRYNFDLSAPPATRDSQIAAILSTYHQAHPSPPSAPATPPPASP